MATRINHLSDFTLYETFTRFDKPVAVPERLRITYFTDTGFPRCFVAERNGSEFRNCALSPDGNTLRVYVSLSRHYIGTGPIKKFVTEIFDDPDFPDGKRRVNAPSDTSIILWSGTSDTSIDASDESVLQDLLYGYSAYELAKKYGYEGTEQEYAMSLVSASNNFQEFSQKIDGSFDGYYIEKENGNIVPLKGNCFVEIPYKNGDNIVVFGAYKGSACDKYNYFNEDSFIGSSNTLDDIPSDCDLIRVNGISDSGVIVFVNGEGLNIVSNIAKNKADITKNQLPILFENGIEEYVACVEKSAYIQAADFAVIEHSHFTLLRKIKLAAGPISR